MRRFAAYPLRLKLKMLLAAASLLLLLPVVAASLHLGRVMDLNRQLTRKEAAELKAAPEKRPALQRQIRDLRGRMDGLGDRAFRDIVSLAALTLVVLVTITLIAPGKLLQPVHRLANLMRQAEGGNLRVVLDQVDSDEIGQVTERLFRLLQELERFDELKRAKITDLVAQRNQLLDLLPTPGLLVDGQGRLLVASRSARQLFGIEEGQLLDRPLLEALGWQETALAGLLASADPQAEVSLELGERRFRVQALRANGDSTHRLVLFSSPASASVRA